MRSHPLFPGKSPWSQQFDSKRISLLWKWPLLSLSPKTENPQERKSPTTWKEEIFSDSPSWQQWSECKQWHLGAKEDCPLSSPAVCCPSHLPQVNEEHGMSCLGSSAGVAATIVYKFNTGMGFISNVSVIKVVWLRKGLCLRWVLSETTDLGNFYGPGKHLEEGLYSFTTIEDSSIYLKQYHWHPSVLCWRLGRTGASLFLMFGFQCYQFHSCIPDFKNLQTMTDDIWLVIIAGFNIRNLWKKLRNSHLLILLYILGRLLFINKHRIPFADFKVTNNLWYKSAAGQGVSLQLAD